MVFDEKKFINVFAFLLAQELQKACPKDTGDLARSFTSTLRIEGSKIIFSLPEYWKYIEYGTGIYGPNKKPIIITLTNKQALYWKGASHPVKKVEIDGIQPNPFIRNTINTKVEELIKKAMQIASQ